MLQAKGKFSKHLMVCLENAGGLIDGAGHCRHTIFSHAEKIMMHAGFYFSANHITGSRLVMQNHILIDKQCRSRSVGFFRSQLIWIYTVCKDRVYLGSAGQGLILRHFISLPYFLKFNNSILQPVDVSKNYWMMGNNFIISLRTQIRCHILQCLI